MSANFGGFRKGFLTPKELSFDGQYQAAKRKFRRVLRRHYTGVKYSFPVYCPLCLKLVTENIPPPQIYNYVTWRANFPEDWRIHLHRQMLAFLGGKHKVLGRMNSCHIPKLGAWEFRFIFQWLFLYWARELETISCERCFMEMGAINTLSHFGHDRLLPHCKQLYAAYWL